MVLVVPLPAAIFALALSGLLTLQGRAVIWRRTQILNACLGAGAFVALFISAVQMSMAHPGDVTVLSDWLSPLLLMFVGGLILSEVIVGRIVAREPAHAATAGSAGSGHLVPLPSRVGICLGSGVAAYAVVLWLLLAVTA